MNMMKRYFKLYSMAQGHRSGFSGSVFRNASSRTGAAPSFDGEMSNLYSIVSEQHRHEKGPWLKILQATKTALQGKQGHIKLLDLASGPGEPGLTIAKEMPHVDVTVTDVSPDQVALATRRTASYPNISTKIVDLTDLSSFDDNTFDMITVCYGYMFCEDKQKACNESYRVLKPGGTLVATYWKNLHPIEFSKKVLAAVYRDGTVPPLSINPMSLSADGICRDFLERAGFSSSRITTEVSEYPFDLGSNKDLVFKLGVLPAYPKLHELKERGDMVKELQRGEEVFWNEIAAAPNVDIDVNGRTIMYDNVFEMITAVK